MNEKIKPIHLERTAYVYVRQSTMHQVRNHRESGRRQFALAEHARQLGFQEVVVIDDDLGCSGTGTQERPGFGRLLSAVCEGKAGAVLALEASRLARNNRDWHHLIDLCMLTETLVIDDDGVYDPRLLNDRLLLGLKGNMAEFELGLLRQRAQEALRQMIARGDVLWEVVIGYVRTEDNGVEMIADRQVQEAIRGVFAKFRELGSARQVLLWYVQEQVPLPSIDRHTNGREIIWKIPGYKRILAFLKNPMYAGAFSYGRRKTKTVVHDGRARKTNGHPVPMEEWDILILDHHAAFISWDEYLRNQKQLSRNVAMRNNEQTGAAKSGSALLAGLLRCRRCGRKLHIGYCGTRGRHIRYYCRGGNINHGTEGCISFGGMRIDQAVSEQILEAVQPMGIKAALDAWDQLAQGEQEKRKALELALEKSRYEIQRARRRYESVDPENRLVATELEARWEEALQQGAELEDRLAIIEAEQAPLNGEVRQRLLDLGGDLAQAWHHPRASASLKKRILRCLLEEIVVDISDDPPRILMCLHWSGGVHTQLSIRRTPPGNHRYQTDRQVVDLVRELAKVCPDRAMAALLNRLGYRTGTGKTWTSTRVASVRNHYGIAPVAKDRHWLTLTEVAELLQLHPGSVRRLIDRKILPAQQVSGSARGRDACGLLLVCCWRCMRGCWRIRRRGTVRRSMSPGIWSPASAIGSSGGLNCTGSIPHWCG